VSASAFLSTLASAAARRARVVLVVAVIAGLAATALALRLHPTAATDTFVSSSSGPYRATQAYYKNFGEEPIAVLVREDLQQLVLSSDLERLIGLEGCLSGNVPASALPAEGGANGPCAKLARAHAVKVVLGPGTFINEAVTQINEQLSAQTHQAEAQAKQAEQAVYQAAIARGLGPTQARTLSRQAGKITITRFQEGLVSLALQYGLTSRPSLQDSSFVTSLVFDSTKPAGTPKQRFAYLFPSRNAALVSVRLRTGLSESQRKSAIGLIRQAVAMPQWHLTRGGSYTITGVPVIVSDLLVAITHAIELLMVAVVVVIAAALGLVFTGRPRLLPLALAILATALTFGALSLAGASLTMASIAVLPVLVGLAVDYAIQFQSRVAEEGSVVAAAGRGGATLLTAGAASAAAMLAMLLSPVPMVRGFGVLLVVGVVLALACTLIVGSAAMSLLPARGGGRPRPSGAPPRGLANALGAVAAAWRGAGELVRSNAATRLVRRVALGAAVRRPERVLCVGLALAALGWGLDTQTRVETDITKLVPQSSSSLQGLNALERTNGVGGEIDLLVRAHDVTAPATIEWMSAYQRAVLAQFGYSASRGCGRARLCPAFSLPDLFQLRAPGSAAAGASAAGGGPGSGGSTGAGGSAGSTGAASAPHLSSTEVNALLAAIPPYFSQDVITPDRRTATLAFGIRAMSLQQQQQLIEAMRAKLRPPAGVSASLVGLPVLAARSGSQVADPWRRLLTLVVGLALVAVVLLAAFRGDRRRALTPLVPIVLATGWSALVLYAVRVPLNPLSVTLGALVIAISTEFSVLLSERFRAESMAGLDTVAALKRSYERTGAAVAASGVTAIAGFGVLALSDIRMLRDFGLVTLIDLSVSLVGVLIALPAVLVIAERGEGVRLRLRTRRRARRGIGPSRPAPSRQTP
jgi:predicted RND superfamily exporter protein